MTGRRIGVYVCQCGGNISDYVDVERVAAAAGEDAEVVVARTAMFTCSDATQQEIVDDIREHGLDGIVVASCSPKLHTATFQGVAGRAGLNPYLYTQVNIREQCSWVHTHDRDGATDKAVRLVRAGMARTRLSTALEPITVDTTPSALVVGGGVTGLRTAIGLADLGLGVYLVEREAELGGRVAGLGRTYPHGRDGRELVERLLADVRRRPEITVFTGAEVVSKTGSFGNYRVGVRVRQEPPETIEVEVGSIVVATGADTYQPAEGELGYGTPGVVTLPELTSLLAASPGPLEIRGRPVRSIAYVYCVGSRQPAGEEGGHTYCSRCCCPATVHTSLQVADRDPGIRQWHLYRDLRTYGSYERMLTRSRERGSVYLRFPDDEPPQVTPGPDGSLTVEVRDLLTSGERVAIAADLVVLVTGMVPRDNEQLVAALKLPVGKEGFFNEVHPKLRPVETVVDGLLIAGAAQGPKSSAEAVTSGLAAAAQAGAVLKAGTAQLDPLVATVDPDTCTWCGACVPACPYAAITPTTLDGRQVATVSAAGCKGCGGCVPVCPEGSIDLLGYTDAQVRAMIDGLLEEVP